MASVKLKDLIPEGYQVPLAIHCSRCGRRLGRYYAGWCKAEIIDGSSGWAVNLNEVRLAGPGKKRWEFVAHTEREPPYGGMRGPTTNAQGFKYESHDNVLKYRWKCGCGPHDIVRLASRLGHVEATEDPSQDALVIHV